MSELRAKKSIEINAPIDKVWGIMAQVDRWPEWIPVIRSAACVRGEPLAAGSRLKFKPELGPIPMNLTVTIIESDPPKHVAWKGGGPGVTGVHSFDLEEKDGKTIVTSSEVFSGFGVPLLRLVMSQQNLDRLHEVWIEGYKKAAEK